MGNYVFCGSSADDPRSSSTGRRETEATPLGEMALVVHGRWKVGRKWGEFLCAEVRERLCLHKSDLYVKESTVLLGDKRRRLSVEDRSLTPREPVCPECPLVVEKSRTLTRVEGPAQVVRPRR
ncbi:hypothetical protein L484_025084 [Morus notabilis]|uniref:Uncharacterized protein n=1 Tax=Morus notabilis TaxID=981085 RepID=W9QT81_9ROSA|nr:hypothetical protein L484_025084 [Morus notabilis]